MKPKGLGLNMRTLKPIDEIRKDVMADFSTIEVEILTAIEFDLEIDLPIKYLKNFRTQYLETLAVQLIKDKSKDRHAVEQIIGGMTSLAVKLVRDQYLRPFCLYFPAPIIFAACLFLANVYTNKLVL